MVSSRSDTFNHLPTIGFSKSNLERYLANISILRRELMPSDLINFVNYAPWWILKPSTMNGKYMFPGSNLENLLISHHLILEAIAEDAGGTLTPTGIIQGKGQKR